MTTQDLQAAVRSAERRAAEAEERARAAERRLDAVVHCVGEWVWTTDPAGNVQRDIPSGRAYTGETLEHVLGRGWVDSIHPDDQPRVLAAWERALATATPYESVQRVRRADGTYRTMLVRGAPVRDDEGRIAEWVGVTTDISDSLQTERELRRLARESAQRAALLDQAYDAVLGRAADGTIFYWNRGAQELYGYSAAEAVGQVSHSLFGTVSPEEQEVGEQGGPQGTVVKAQEAALARDGHWEGEVLHRTRDGRHVIVESRQNVVQTENGRVVVLEANRDITERRQLERRTGEALDALLNMARVLVDPLGMQASVAQGEETAGSLSVREISQHLAELTAGVLGCKRVGISIIEPDTQRVRAVAVVGLPPKQERQWWAEQEALTIRYGEGVDPDLLARFNAGEALVLDMTQPPYDQLPNPYGITTSLTAPLRVGGAVVGMLSLDYGGPRHEFVPSEIALTEAVAQLAALVIERDRLLREREDAHARELALLTINQHMDDFLSMAAHDMKSPVAGAKLVAQTAQRRVKRLAAELRDATPNVARYTADLEHALNTVTEQMNRLARLVDRLLDVTRARTGRLEIAPEPCDLAQLVRQAFEQQRAVAANRPISLRLPESGPVKVEADPTRIDQVMTNYLTNACRYSEADAPVDVVLEVRDEQARVSVRDRGQGIPPEEREAIWSRFERAKGVKHQSGTDTGLGLGLFISKSIVEQHGGSVGVESAVGRGSTFWFTLPLLP